MVPDRALATMPVVLDSPRDRQLDNFPESMLLGPDFGYVTRGIDEEPSSLDSFGSSMSPPIATLRDLLLVLQGLQADRVVRGWTRHGGHVDHPLRAVPGRFRLSATTVCSRTPVAIRRPVLVVCLEAQE